MGKPVYSFSRLSSWDSCKRAFAYKYVDGIEGKDNWFSRFGTLAHKIFESVDKGELPAKDAFDTWRNEYPNAVIPDGGHEFPWMLKWYEQAAMYFFAFNGFATTAIWVEHYIEVERENYILRGYVDRMSRTKHGLSIQDHKSSNPYKGDDLLKKQRQLYLYAEAVRQAHGELPSTLMFNHFRTPYVEIIQFNEHHFNEAWDWADRTVSDIETAIKDVATEYPPTVTDFFCKNICDFRAICPHHIQPQQEYRPRKR